MLAVENVFDKPPRQLKCLLFALEDDLGMKPERVKMPDDFMPIGMKLRATDKKDKTPVEDRMAHISALARRDESLLVEARSQESPKMSSSPCHNH